MHYAWTKRLFLPVVATIIVILALSFSLNSFIAVKLIKGNKALVEQLVKILQESSVAKQKIKEINKEREDLEIRLEVLQQRIQTVEEERIAKESAAAAEQIVGLNAVIAKLAQEKTSLQEQLINLQKREAVITEDLLHLDRKKATLEKANLDKMYQWLKIHQNPRTGLVMSFEGDGQVKNWAFTYDQALVSQIYTNFSDFERAKKVFDFFLRLAKRSKGAFLNAYYVDDGEPAEYVVHSGPNIWLGIAILQYTHKTKDTTYLGLAEEIASFIVQLQNENKDGGLRGGPDVEWYSTEHNLDAYAFFNMLAQMTGNLQYQQARDKTLAWLAKHTYDRTDVPIKRGKGDSTIATDTYAWSIAAIGPKELEGVGMNPDRIMEFAEQNCKVDVAYARPEGQTIQIKGFDFAPQRHVSRGGVVSSEWTAQMAIAFKIMSDYYYKKGLVAKARSYVLKADECLTELGRMIISSPSPSGQGESCLPYATQDNVDTGHGWMTPKGASTGSLAGTTYVLFAYYNYNPLVLEQ
jgi:hypothetical protein